jgi:hypothetical protein
MHKCLDKLTMTPDYVLLDGTVWDNVGKYKIELVTKVMIHTFQLQLRLL